MGKIKKILENELVGGTQTTDVYPVTSVKAVYDENNERLDHILNRRGVVNVSTNYNNDHIAEVLTLFQAINKVPASDRVLGFQGKYLASDSWHTIIYIGDSLTSWSDTTKWVDLADKVFKSISKNATFSGIATPTTNPGIPDGPVFYIATQEGIYSNFGSIEVANGEAAILEWKGSWVKKDSGFASKSFVDLAIHNNLRYVYWSPSSSPVLERVSDAVNTVSYEHLSIVDILTKNLYINFSSSGVTIEIDNKGIILVYAKIVRNDKIELRYSYILELDNSTHTDDYEAITDISKVIPLAIVENNMLEDILKINSWSQFTAVPSVVTDITNLNKRVDNSETNIKYANGINYYTYWTPSSAPVLKVLEDKMVFSYDKLTLVNVSYYIKDTTYPNSTKVFQTNNLSIDIPNTMYVYLVYYDMNKKEIYYDTINQPSSVPNTDFFKKVINPEFIIPLAIIEHKHIYDILALNSRYFPGQFDLSTEGLARRLYPENVISSGYDPLLFIKYKWDITGSKENTTAVDVRLSARLHTKHKFLYVRGKVDFEEGKFVSPQIFIDNNKFAINENKNTFGPYNLTCDDEGYFDEYVTIPETAWDTVDFDTYGYNALVILVNANKYRVGLHIYESFMGDYPGKDNHAIMNEQIEDTIKYAEQLNTVIEVNEDNKVFGNDSLDPNINSVIPIDAHVNVSATTTNSEAESDGFLTEITALVHNAGTYKFKVGLLDQYPRFVPSYEFTLNLADGRNVIDVSSMNIPIAKGEQLAISCTSTAGISGTSSLMYRQNSKAIEHEMFYGPNNGTWYKLASTYGGEIVLSYKMKTIETIFALKSQIEQLNEQIEKQNNTINSIRYVYDNNGVPYKLSIYNGEIVIKSVQYKKVLALGNSLTSHGFAESIGYYGDIEWAMASTNKVTTTWTNHLQTILRQKQPSATVTPFNIAAWEINYMGVVLDDLFASHKGVDYDLIIIRAGENGTAGSDYAQGVDRLVSYLRENFPLADIIITDMFWHNSVKEAGFREIAEKYNYPYISFGNIADKCLLGQMLLGRDNTFHPITHNGVAGHCTDVCFFEFANILANSLSYEAISGKHSVIMSSSKKYGLNNTSQIHDGYVTILTYEASEPTVNVEKASGGLISTETFDLSEVTWINTPSEIPTFAVVFKMPDEDVNVSY